MQRRQAVLIVFAALLILPFVACSKKAEDKKQAGEAKTQQQAEPKKGLSQLGEQPPAPALPEQPQVQLPPARGQGQDISGTYALVKDSDGKVPGKQAAITLTLAGGQAVLMAIKPDDMLSDTGQYQAGSGRITIKFDQMEIGAENKPFRYDGTQLVLPFKALSDGEGTSTWTKISSASTIK